MIKQCEWIVNRERAMATFLEDGAMSATVPRNWWVWVAT